MVKKLLKIVSVLILLALIVAGVFFYSIYISVDRVNLSYQTISSSKIPEDMNDLKIAFISDIKYNEYMNKERLTSMISKLNTTGADVVIFGGDMFSNPQTKAPDSQMSKDLTTILKSIDAPLGKFAVLGDEDLANDKTKKIVSQILYDSDFEILSDTSIRLRNKGDSSISLIGLNNMLNTMEGAATYNHGSYDINGTSLYVSNGLGTKDIDMRLLAPPQILVFRLQHESGKK